MNLAPFQLLQAVSKATRITAMEVMSPSRASDISRARFLLVELIRHAYPHWTTITTAQFIQRKDHTTVVHSRRRAAALLDSDPYFQNAFERALEFLNQQNNA